MVQSDAGFHAFVVTVFLRQYDYRKLMICIDFSGFLMPNLHRSAIFIPQVLRYTLRYVLRKTAHE
jgi:hypothetical protein